MCKYGCKKENARFGMRAAIAKQVRGDAAPERLRFSVFNSVRIAGRVLVSAPARGSARVTGRRQPPRKLCRRLVSKTSTRLALTPVYLPYINRISGVIGYFGAKTSRFTAVRKCFWGTLFKARKCRYNARLFAGR